MFIQRRRAKMSQGEMGDGLGVTNWQISQWERDKMSINCPQYNVGELSSGEGCLIHRRRSGLTRRKLSKLTGWSHVRIQRMEEDVWDNKVLVAYYAGN
ncbi:MAG: helix-turn-helix transcriptional regulator [Gammaproteobacteria bacterium]